MNDRPSMDRRDFLRRTAATGMTLGLGGSLWGYRPARGQEAPNERLNLAFIGVGGMGGSHLSNLTKDKRFEITGICELDAKRRQTAVDRVKAAGRAEPKTHIDYKEVLARKDVDAVLVATPDHWHATIAVHAVRAGKDVYVEKPMSHDVEEGRILVEEAKKYGRKVQVGTQQRSDRNFRRAVEIVRSGQLGEIKSVRGWKNPRVLRLDDAGAIKNRAQQADLDWDRWLGPSPLIPFDYNRAHYAWRYFWDQGGGLMTDWGVHMIDILQWAMRSEKPLSVEATGTRAENSPMEVPYEIEAHYEFPGFSLAWLQGKKIERDPDEIMTDHGIAFIGSEAQLYVCRGQMPKLFPDTFKEQPIPDDVKLPVRGSHYDDWLACIKDRKLTPVADCSMGHTSTTTANLGNVAYRTGRKLRWDGDKEEFIGDAEATKMIKHHPRKPYTID